MPTDPMLLVDLIYKNSKQEDLLLPQITRLVKLMYLTELEYFRLRHERLTDLDWTFYLFGPYPMSLRSFLGEPEIESKEWRSGKTSKSIVRGEDIFMKAKAELDLEAIIKRVVKTWGDADLNQLLDYVYFETEPMQNAKRGDLLDFSSVAADVAKKLQVNLDRAKLSEIKKKVSERAKAYAQLRQASSPPLDLAENLAIWDEEETRLFPSGPCKIRLSDLVPKE
ncbi:MAG: type II toxin-antitoxin system antitoxin SocA domain-containing protein [Candidatus Acidiferrales bacterium]